MEIYKIISRTIIAIKAGNQNTKEFSQNTAKESYQDRIGTLVVNEKIIKKKTGIQTSINDYAKDIDNGLLLI